MSAPFLPSVQGAMFPVVSLSELPEGLEGVERANRLIRGWGHNLGAIERPFGAQPWVLEIDEQPVSVAVSVSIVSPTAAGLPMDEVVELGRLCSDPGQAWANRVMLRLWREVCARRWPHWPVRAAVSYSQNDRHEGRLYRFDGWTKVREDAGGDCGPNATWSKRRGPEHAAAGAKTLWLWEYEQAPEMTGRRRRPRAGEPAAAVSLFDDPGGEEEAGG